MSIADEIKKAAEESKKQQQQDDQSTWWSIADQIKAAANKSKPISASQTLQESLEWVEKHTALSTWMLWEYRDSAVNFFDNARHTVTDKDEEHGIKDYSQYKMYKSALDNAEPWQDVDAIYKQMADENVIDYNKFSSRVNSDEYKKRQRRQIREL